MEKNEKPLSLVEKMRLKAQQQKKYGGELTEESAILHIRNCPNCGAGRTQHDGLTKCGYCGFMFTEHKLNNGINMKETDNSR